MSQHTPAELQRWAVRVQEHASRIRDLAAVEVDAAKLLVLVWTDAAGRATRRLVRDLGIPDGAVRVERPGTFLIPYPNDDERTLAAIHEAVTTDRLGLEPVVGTAPRVLILGSMPGNRSLEQFEYYAHPQNRFWRLAEEAFGISRSQPYDVRIQALAASGIALWDVLKQCRREGSLDQNIDPRTEIPNDIPGFLDRSPTIELVALNGAKAARAYRRHIQGRLSQELNERITVRELPSTSAANTRFTYAALAQQWRRILAGTRG